MAEFTEAADSVLEVNEDETLGPLLANLSQDELISENSHVSSEKHVQIIWEDTDLEVVSSVQKIKMAYKDSIKNDKPSGKLAETPHEMFTEGIYRPKAHYNGFRTKPERIPYWSFALYKAIVVKYIECNQDVFQAVWRNRINYSGTQFDQIECKVNYVKGLKHFFTLRIHLSTSSVSIQGPGYSQFITNCFGYAFDIVQKEVSAIDVNSDSALSSESLSDTVVVTSEEQPSPLCRNSPTLVTKSSSGTLRVPNGNDSSPDISSTMKQISSQVETEVCSLLSDLKKIDVQGLLKTLNENNKKLEMKIDTLVKSFTDERKRQQEKIASLESVVNSVKSSSCHLHLHPNKDQGDLIKSQAAQISILMGEVDKKQKELDKVKGQIIDPKHLQNLRETIDLKNSEIAVLKEKLSYFENKMNGDLQMKIDLESLAEINETLKEQLENVKLSFTTVEDQLKMKNSELEEVIRGLKNDLSSKNSTIEGLRNKNYESNNQEHSHTPRKAGNSNSTTHVELIGDSRIKFIKPEFLLPKSEKKVFIKESTIYTWEEALNKLETLNQ